MFRQSLTGAVRIREVKDKAQSFGAIRQKKGHNPTCCALLIRTRELPAIAAAASIPLGSTAITIAAGHRFGFVHDQRSPVELRAV